MWETHKLQLENEQKREITHTHIQTRYYQSQRPIWENTPEAHFWGIKEHRNSYGREKWKGYRIPFWEKTQVPWYGAVGFSLNRKAGSAEWCFGSPTGFGVEMRKGREVEAKGRRRRSFSDRYQHFYPRYFHFSLWLCACASLWITVSQISHPYNQINI